MTTTDPTLTDPTLTNPTLTNPTLTDRAEPAIGGPTSTDAGRRSGGRLARRVTGGAVAGLALLLTGSSVGAASPCEKVKGSYDEHAETAGCASPVGLCIAGVYSGSIKGDFFGTALTVVPNADTGTTGVLTFTAHSVIHAKLRGEQGDLVIDNAGVFQTTPPGNIVDLQTIVGGTGDLAGATGAIRASGVFTSGAGTSAYEGQVCLPRP